MNEQSILTALAVLRTHAFSEEYDIHRQIEQALRQADIDYIHECAIAPRCRIDFLVGRIGLEVKKQRPQKQTLLRQLKRYAASDALDAIIVICPQSISLPEKILGKSVRMFPLQPLWGVALP